MNSISKFSVADVQITDLNLAYLGKLEVELIRAQRTAETPADVSDPLKMYNDAKKCGPIESLEEYNKIGELA
jgi:hypothetical protein